MSYVELKHLLADLTLEAVRAPAGAGWLTVAAAYADLATAAQPEIPWPTCLERARALTADLPPAAHDAGPRASGRGGWTPGEPDARRLAAAGLFSDRVDRAVLSDRFLPHLVYFRRQVGRALKAVAGLQAEEPAAAPSEIRAGAALFNAGLFFECHEWFEGLWKTASGEPKDFYQGIVQAAAAFYHYEKNNRRGCRTLLRKGRRRLAPYPAQFAGLDLAGFREALDRWAQHCEGGPRPDDYPGVRLLPPSDAREETKGAPRG